jgi:hypothetical protein
VALVPVELSSPQRGYLTSFIHVLGRIDYATVSFHNSFILKSTLMTMVNFMMNFNKIL